jgi:hypothetical protein
MCIAMSVGELVSAYPVIQFSDPILSFRLLADCTLRSSILLPFNIALLLDGSQAGSISLGRRQGPPRLILHAVELLKIPPLI